MSNVLGIITGLFLVWAFFSVTGNDADEAQAQVDHYCKMVSIYKQSRGEYGWPDYDNKYDRECKE